MEPNSPSLKDGAIGASGGGRQVEIFLPKELFIHKRSVIITIWPLISLGLHAEIQACDWFIKQCKEEPCCLETNRPLDLISAALCKPGIIPIDPY